MDETTEPLCAVELYASGAAPRAPEWIHLAAAGAPLEGRDGGQFRVDHPEAVIRATTFPMAIDRDHDSMLPWGRGTDAGQIQRIEYLDAPRDGRAAGFWARVRSWTPAARGEIEHRDFRSLVLLAQVDTATGRVLAFRSASLSSRSPRPVAKSPPLAEPPAPEPAADPEPPSRAKPVTPARRTSRPVAPAAPGSDSSELGRKAVAEAFREAADAKRELAMVRRERLDEKIGGVIGAAVKAGKVTPAAAKYHRESVKTAEDLAAFEAHVATLPVLIGTGIDPLDEPDSSTEPLDETEKLVAEQLGLSAEEWTSEDD